MSAPPEPPFLSVTNREVYAEIQEMKAMLASTLSRMESHTEHYETHERILTDHEARLRALDLKFYGILAGGLGLLGALIVALVNGGLGIA